VLLVSGDIRRRTGGNLYDLRMARACRRAGVPLRIVTVRSTTRARSVLARERPRLVVIDSIAVDLVAPLLPWLREELGARVIALMHMATAARGTRSVLRSADRIVAVSTDLGRILVSHGAARSRIVVIAPGSDRASPVARTRRRVARVRVLTVANWSPSKGIVNLVAAAAHVPEVRLDLVGDTGPASYRNAVIARIRSSEMRERVFVHGSLGERALARRYAQADVFALPSEREGYGTVFAEAIGHGLPVIAADITTARDIAGDAGLYVPPRRVRPLVAALRLVTDAWLRRRLAAAARSRARSLPTWRVSEAAFVALARSEMRSTRARS
jgi:glycosyltransferase involved in cell wall biosynthesis